MKKLILSMATIAFAVGAYASNTVDIKTYKVAYLNNVTDSVVIMDLDNKKEIVEVLKHPPRLQSINGVKVAYTMDRIPQQQLRGIYAFMENQKLASTITIKHVVVNERNEIVYFELWDKDKNVSNQYASFINKHCKAILSDDKLLEKQV